MNRWRSLCIVLEPFETIEPALECLRWPIYRYHISQEQLVPTGAKAWLMQARRCFFSIREKASDHQKKSPLWFALHGSTPSHLLPFQAVMHEMAERDLTGLAVGPFPYETLSLDKGWRQVPLDIGFPEAGLILFNCLYKKACAYAPDLRKALLETGLWPEAQAPSLNILTDWIWTALRLDWDIAQRLQRYTPRVLVLGSDLGFLRNPLARHARALGAYTLVLQHGLQGEYAGSVSTNEVSLWGEYHRRQTVELGAPPKALVVDGSPRMDTILKLVNDPATRASARKTLNIPQDAPVILHISDGINRMKKSYPEITDRFLKDAPLAFCAISREAIYLIRPHPIENDSDWSFLETKDNIRIIPKNQMGLYDLIAAADVVTVILSAGGLEAIWCSKPVLFYQPVDVPPVHNFVATGGGLAIRNSLEWADMALSLVRDHLAQVKQVENTADFCADTLAFPGQASQKVVDRIEQHL